MERRLECDCGCWYVYIHEAEKLKKNRLIWQVLPTPSISVHMRRSRSLRVEMRMVIIHLLLVFLSPGM